VNWRLTAKLPLLVAGTMLVASGLGLLGWSSNVSRWCEPAVHEFGAAKWGEDAFQDQPSLATCLRLALIRQNER
jgi:hypothetical protein